MSPQQPPIPNPDDLDLRLTRALETPLTFRIPHDFAARVAASAPPRPTPALTPSHFGRSAVLLTMAALILIMLALAPTALQTATVPLALELSFAAEFAALIIYISLRPSILR